MMCTYCQIEPKTQNMYSSEMVQSHESTKIQAPGWNSTDFSQITAVSISAYRCPTKEPKKHK
jgi:hypothetical protein